MASIYMTPFSIRIKLISPLHLRKLPFQSSQAFWVKMINKNGVEGRPIRACCFPWKIAATINLLPHHPSQDDPHAKIYLKYIPTPRTSIESTGGVGWGAPSWSLARGNVVDCLWGWGTTSTECVYLGHVTMRAAHPITPDCIVRMWYWRVALHWSIGRSSKGLNNTQVDSTSLKVSFCISYRIFPFVNICFIWL